MGDSVVHALDGVDLTIGVGEFASITGRRQRQEHHDAPDRCLDRPTPAATRSPAASWTAARLPPARSAPLHRFVYQDFNSSTDLRLYNVPPPHLRTIVGGPAKALEPWNARPGPPRPPKPNELSGGERQLSRHRRALSTSRRSCCRRANLQPRLAHREQSWSFQRAARSGRHHILSRLMAVAAQAERVYICGTENHAGPPGGRVVPPGNVGQRSYQQSTMPTRAEAGTGAPGRKHVLFQIINMALRDLLCQPLRRCSDARLIIAWRRSSPQCPTSRAPSATSSSASKPGLETFTIVPSLAKSGAESWEHDTAHRRGRRGQPRLPRLPQRWPAPPPRSAPRACPSSIQQQQASHRRRQPTSLRRQVLLQELQGRFISRVDCTSKKRWWSGLPRRPRPGSAEPRGEPTSGRRYTFCVSA